jgi:hypothetical protein
MTDCVASRDGAVLRRWNFAVSELTIDRERIRAGPTLRGVSAIGRCGSNWRKLGSPTLGRTTPQAD